MATHNPVSSGSTSGGGGDAGCSFEPEPMQLGSEGGDRSLGVSFPGCDGTLRVELDAVVLAGQPGCLFYLFILRLFCICFFN